VLGFHLFGVCISLLADEMPFMPAFTPSFSNLRPNGPCRTPELLCERIHLLSRKSPRQPENRPRNGLGLL